MPLEIAFGVGPLPRPASTYESDPLIGDRLAICVRGISVGERVQVRIDAPDEDPPLMSDEARYEPGQIQVETDILPEYGTGTWTITASAPSGTATLDIPVGVATTPGYRVIQETDSTAALLAVGLAPNQPFSIHFYESTPGELVADYVSTLEARAGGDGTRLVKFSRAGGSEHCNIAKVTVEERMLADGHNTLSTLCPP